MGSEEGELVTLTEPEDFWAWVFFTMGGCAQAAYVESGDKERDRRSRQASVRMGQLVPAIAAALKVSMRHPEEFRKELGEPVRLERVTL